MVELHSNFTVSGQTQVIDGVRPTNHQERETLELTAGINDWAEVGFYVFSAAQSGYGWQWVGDHIRPRVRAPDKWHLPVGLSLSTEIGYQRPEYSPDTWTWEIRPIVDKTVGRWYFAFNPALERTLHGPDVNQGLGFSPGAKVSYDFTKKISGGFEYYADYGRWGSFDDLRNQQQQLFVVTDLNVSPVWEINFGDWDWADCFDGSFDCERDYRAEVFVGEAVDGGLMDRACYPAASIRIVSTFRSSSVATARAAAFPYGASEVEMRS